MIPLLLAWFALGFPASAAEPIAAIRAIVPFTLAQPYRHAWQAERPIVDQGLLLVLQVDPQVARPRQAGGAVLYVGAVPAERLSWAAQSELLVVVIPGAPDLATTPVYWGSETLPERVDQAWGATELAQAQAQGIDPRPAAELGQARALGGDVRRLEDQAAVYALGAELMGTWVPEAAVWGPPGGG